MKIAFFYPACITCNRQVQEAIWNSTFFPNLFTMLSGFIVLGALVTFLSVLSARQHKARISGSPKSEQNPVPLSTAAMVLGIGLGGFADGIILHQLLQWHEMISNKLPPTTLVNKSVNMFWDGVFHAFCLAVVIIGIVLLWRLLRQPEIDRSGCLLSGGLLAGWGLFNIIEGVIDHHLLKLHNVREITPQVQAWNLGFLGISLLMLMLGYALIKKRRGNNYSK